MKGALIMRKHSHLAAGFLGLSLVVDNLGATAQTPTPHATSTIAEVRHELLQLPYYGVYDFIAFSYNKGAVTLQGYAYEGRLRADAERAVKRASGVDQVIDQIEQLPPWLTDDEIRWKAYYAIFNDPFLSSYAPGGGMLWGHPHAIGSDFLDFGPARFPGTEPAGNYPIHIIVKNLHITLLGVVESDADKDMAGIKMREVPGGMGTDNELVVENAKQSTRN
jgi:hyperosmotically inducible protein